MANIKLHAIKPDHGFGEIISSVTFACMSRTVTNLLPSSCVQLD